MSDRWQGSRALGVVADRVIGVADRLDQIGKDSSSVSVTWRDLAELLQEAHDDVRESEYYDYMGEDM